MRTKCPTCGQLYRVKKPNSKKKVISCVRCGNHFHYLAPKNVQPGEPNLSRIDLSTDPACHASGCKCHRCRKMTFIRTDPVSPLDALIIVATISIPIAILILGIAMMSGL